MNKDITQSIRRNYKIGVRRIDRSDLDQVFKLIKMSSNDKTRITKKDLEIDLFSYDPGSTLGNSETNSSKYNSNKPNAQMLVAVSYPDDLNVEVNLEEPCVVGYICFHYYYTPWIGHSTKIADIFVEPTYRRKGIARKMMTEFETLSKFEGMGGIATNVDLTRLSGHSEIIKTLLANGFRVLRCDKTDWSVFKMYI